MAKIRGFHYPLFIMKLTKILVLAASLFSILPAAYLSASDFNEKEQAAIDQILAVRLKLRTFSNIDDSISCIKEYKETFEQSVKPGLGTEARITAENMIATALYNCTYEKDTKDPQLENILRPQYEACLAYEKQAGKDNLNPYFSVTYADITNSMMQFMSRSDAMKAGLEEKKDYERMLKANPNHCLALMNSAFWYYFAPAIGGGSKAKAMEYFTAAWKNAKTDYEKFYATIYYSQEFFEAKDFASAEKYLAQAEAMVSGTNYIAKIKKINSLGYSIFDYSMNSTKEKVDKKLAAMN